MSPLNRPFGGPPALHCAQGPDAGPPLLLLHGVLRNGLDWEPLLPDLTRYWRVYLLDHCGHGQSARADGAYCVADYAHSVADFVRATFSEPLTVLGHSLGAMVALSLAVDCASQIAAIVLEDPPFHTMGRNIAATPYHALFLAMADVQRRGGDVAAMTDGLAAIPINGAKRLGDVRDRESLAFSAQCLTTLDPKVFTPLTDGTWLDRFEYESLWSQVNCPVLLLQADPQAGGAFTDADMSLARRDLRDHQHVRFPRTSHQIHRERPAEMVAALQAFIG